MENSQPKTQSNSEVVDQKVEGVTSPSPKKPLKKPKLEDKPFDEFIKSDFIPGLKKAIQDKGTDVVGITTT